MIEVSESAREEIAKVVAESEKGAGVRVHIAGYG